MMLIIFRSSEHFFSLFQLFLLEFFQEKYTAKPHSFFSVCVLEIKQFDHHRRVCVQSVASSMSFYRENSCFFPSCVL